MRKPMRVTCALMNYANINECRGCQYIKSIDGVNGMVDCGYDDILKEELCLLTLTGI